MRIGPLTRPFPPGPKTVLAAAIADRLSEHGYDIGVLTGFPNYPTGKLHPDYAMLTYRRDQGFSRVEVHRAPINPSDGSSAVGRMANYRRIELSEAAAERPSPAEPRSWLTCSPHTVASRHLMVAAIRLLATFPLIVRGSSHERAPRREFIAGASERATERSLNAYDKCSCRRSATDRIISSSKRRRCK